MSGFGSKYPIPLKYKSEFTPDEASDMRKAFQVFDVNGDGHIDDKELKQIMDNLGEKVSADALKKMVDEVDTDGNHEIEWIEFCDMMHNIHKGVSGGKFFFVGVSLLVALALVLSLALQTFLFAMCI